MSHLRKVEIVANALTKGVGTDAEVLTHALERLGVSVTTRVPPSNRRDYLSILAVSSLARRFKLDRVGLQLAKRLRGRQERTKSGVVMLLENSRTSDTLSSATTVLIPNPEWLNSRTEWQLPLVDLIACKTRHAMEIFRTLGFDPHFLGFTTRDLGDARTVADRSRFLHVASDGLQKGTAEVLRAWTDHPEWPPLTVLAGVAQCEITNRPNVHVIRDWLPPSRFAELMREHGVHLCCSNSEGFGHTIAESMACGVLVISTDAAPMNEIVTNERGMLVRTASSRSMRQGTWYELDEESLVSTIESAIVMPDEDYHRRCTEARSWFERNDLQFNANLAQLLERLGEPRGMDPRRPLEKPPEKQTEELGCLFASTNSRARLA